MEKIVLHSCCAPCSAPILEWLLRNDYRPVIFFFNPNIFPSGEYLLRKKECMHYAGKLGIEFIDGDYDHGKWLEAIRGSEEEPERGERCQACFGIRMAATALLTRQRGLSTFTTTLTGSRWKSFEQIARAGHRAASTAGDIRFWDKDWKKGGLTERRKVLLRENGFYNQQYCGCEFSMRRLAVEDPGLPE